MQHIMIDIETLGQPPDGAILSIGWCLFNLPPKDFNPVIENANVLVSDAVLQGMTLDKNTVLWWMRSERSAALRDSLEQQVNLSEALELLEDAADWGKLEGVWCRSPRFDFEILSTAFRLCNMAVPWNFRQERDQRTIVAVGESLPLLPHFPIRETPEHIAAGDAIYQAEVLCAYYKAMRGD